jgi:hypothetical protein
MLPFLVIPYFLNLVLATAGAYILNELNNTPTKKYKIVGFKMDSDLRNSQEVLAIHGLKVKKLLPLANACVCEFDAEDSHLKTLAENPAVEFIEDDCVCRIQGQETPWDAKKIGAPNVDNTGVVVKVGIIEDIGKDTSLPDLKNNIKELGGVGDCKNIVDANVHGSHLAGTVAAFDNTRVVGAAPMVAFAKIKLDQLRAK